MQKWRVEHQDEIVERRNNRTEEEMLADQAKKTEEMRRYRREHKDEIKAREAAPPLEENSAVRQCRFLGQKFRAKQKLENPKPTHVVPDENKGRNSRRNEHCNADPHKAKKVSLQVQVSRAKKKLDNVCLDGSSPEAVHKATVNLAVAQIERYKFTTSIVIEPSIQPSAEDWELAASRP